MRMGSSIGSICIDSSPEDGRTSHGSAARWPSGFLRQDDGSLTHAERRSARANQRFAGVNFLFAPADGASMRAEQS